MTLEITNRIKEIERVHFQLREYCRNLPLTDYELKKINIAVDEILSNIISYGYDDHDGHTIFLKFESSEDELVMEFVDDGKFFDPTNFVQHHLPRTRPDDDQNGGLGLHLVHRLMNRMHYERMGNQNKLILNLKFANKALDIK